MQKEVIITNQKFNSLSQFINEEVIISVENPTLHESQIFGSYYSYSVIGSDTKGQYNVSRRYSDFDLLRKRLAQRWLGVYIPPISGKRAENNPLYVLKYFENNKDEGRYAETRQRFLKYFCQGIAIRPYLYQSDIFQLFIRGGNNFQAEISGILSKQSTFLLNDYDRAFKQIVPEIELKQLITNNEANLLSLKNSEAKLQEMCQQIFKANQFKEQFNQQFNICFTKTFPDYEENFLLLHVRRDRQQLILNKNQDFALVLAQYKGLNVGNSLEGFLQLIMYQIRETKAFIEAIEGRKEAEKRKFELKDKIESKEKQKASLLSGAFSFKSLFKTGSKQLQINEIDLKLQILKTQLICIEKMIIMMVVNTNTELFKYRNRRGQDYARIFRNIAEKQLIEIDTYKRLLAIPQAALG